MKHHKYQIYYGGFKIKLKDIYYCKDCKLIVSRSHKKPTGLPRYKLEYKKWNVIPKKN